MKKNKTNLKKILLIEDDPTGACLTKMLLEPKNFKIDWVSTSQEALEKLSNSQYQFVFMDIGLPNDDGLALAGRLRTQNSSSITIPPIIAFTAHAAQDERVTEAKNNGMRGFVTKPLTIEKCELLIHELSKVLANKRYFFTLGQEII